MQHRHWRGQRGPGGPCLKKTNGTKKTWVQMKLNVAPHCIWGFLNIPKFLKDCTRLHLGVVKYSKNSQRLHQIAFEGSSIFQYFKNFSKVAPDCIWGFLNIQKILKCCTRLHPRVPNIQKFLKGCTRLHLRVLKYSKISQRLHQIASEGT